MPTSNIVHMSNDAHTSCDAGPGFIVYAGTGSDTVNADYAGAETVTGAVGTLTFIQETALPYYAPPGGTPAATPDNVVETGGTLIAFTGLGGGTFQGGAAGHNVFVDETQAGSSITMTGAGQGDQFFGSGADDNATFNLGAGQETALLGAGGGIVNGGVGRAVIFGGSGSSVVYDGTAGGDTVVGGSGNLNLFAQNGDAIFGGSGASVITGSKAGGGADSIVGSTGGMYVMGQGANMLVVAGAGNDRIDTGNGAALVFAGSGNTTLNGGTGSLQISIGNGHDTVQAGSGIVTLDITTGAAGGSMMLSGWQPGRDQVNAFGYGAGQETVSQTGGNTLVSFSDGTKITLVGVAHV